MGWVSHDPSLLTPQWYADTSGPETYVRPVRDTFIDIQHWRLTHGYGAMRENEYQLVNILKTLQQSMTASFVGFPEEARHASLEEVLHQRYIAFVTCSSEELVKSSVLSRYQRNIVLRKTRSYSRSRREDQI